ncbi:MAG: DUF4339 domain-containing protein [Thermoguttaceae bacterium]
MGIRFFCPNGHKLNVKDFQAGRTGICPCCGVKMPIPLESTRRSSKQERSLQRGGDTMAALASETMAPQPAETAPVSCDVLGDTPVFADAKTGTVAAKRVNSRDPLAEAGDAVWYVHPPSGGQFGPAAADVMRAWIAEGRISVDSLVWHEGWRNWQMAGKVFPQLSPPAADSVQEPGVPKLVVTSVRSSGAPNYRRKRANTVQIVFVGSLTLAVIVLFFIFYAIFKQ